MFAVPDTKNIYELQKPGARGRPFRVGEAAACAEFESDTCGVLYLRWAAIIAVTGCMHVRRKKTHVT